MGIFAAVVIPAPGGTKNPHPAGVGGFLTTPWTKADSALFPGLYKHPHPQGWGCSSPHLGQKPIVRCSRGCTDTPTPQGWGDSSQHLGQKVNGALLPGIFRSVPFLQKIQSNF